MRLPGVVGVWFAVLVTVQLCTEVESGQDYLSDRLACDFVCNKCGDNLSQNDVFILSQILSECAKEKAFDCDSYQNCLQTLFPKNSTVEASINDIIKVLSTVYHSNATAQCVSVRDFLNDSSVVGSGLGQFEKENITSEIVHSIFSGNCFQIIEAIADFREDLFYHYGDRCDEIITTKGFNRIINDLRHPDGKEDRKLKELEGVEECQQVRTKRALESHVHFKLANTCFSSDNLLERFGLKGSNMSWQEFTELCPAIIQQVVSGVCEKNRDVIVTEAALSNLQVYGYGCLAVFIVSLCSLAGIVIAPLVKTRVYDYLLSFLFALSFGTMTGDAFLHLIPQFLGLHDHEGVEEHVHNDAESIFSSVAPSFWKLLALLIASCVLFFFEIIFENLSRLGSKVSPQENGGSHGHSHFPSQVQLKSFKAQSPTESNINLTMNSSNMDLNNSDVAKGQTILKRKMFGSLTVLAVMVLLGDSVHNFADGVAIGAAFSTSLQGGVSTTIAVLLHELPHELGDFAVLLSSGFTFKGALLANLFSSLTSFGGLVLGVEIGADTETRSWMLAVVAGMFIFVAFSEMIPEIRNNKRGNPLLMCFVSMFGTLFGIAIMVAVSLFEELISI